MHDRRPPVILRTRRDFGKDPSYVCLLMIDDGRHPERDELKTKIFELERNLATLKRELGALPSAAAATFEILVFGVHDKRYALRLTDVVEVLRMVKASTLPGAPTDIYGVINCRGSILPVLNPGALLSDRAVEASLHAALIVVATLGQRVAVMVDSVLAVEAVRPGEFKRVSNAEAQQRTLPNYVVGFVWQQEQHVAVVDVEQLLSHEDHRVLVEALQARERAEKT